MVWRDMVTNEEFRLFPNGKVYRSGPRFEDDFRPNPGGVLVETISSSILDFVRDIQNDPQYLVEHVHRRFFPRQTRKVAPVGRKAVWVKWLDKTDGVEYVLKSDFSIRAKDGYDVTMHLPSTTDVPMFLASLRRECHEIVYIHPRFQKPRDVVKQNASHLRRRGKPTPSPTRENGAMANVRPVKAV